MNMRGLVGEKIAEFAFANFLTPAEGGLRRTAHREVRGPEPPHVVLIKLTKPRFGTFYPARAAAECRASHLASETSALMKDEMRGFSRRRGADVQHSPRPRRSSGPRRAGRGSRRSPL